MGLDGTQRLEIRGPKESLDELEDSGIVVLSESPVLSLEIAETGSDFNYIASRFFGTDLVNVISRDDNHLVVSYGFRNRPVYEYLTHVLKAYPKCWMKNEFTTDGGLCGIWVASMCGSEAVTQELEWGEPSIEEKCFETDFSRT